MKEINEIFKIENYECNLLVQENRFDIGLSGYDNLTKEDVLDYQSFKNCKALLEYLREIKFDKAINFHLSLFANDLIKCLYKHKLV